MHPEKLDVFRKRLLGYDNVLAKYNNGHNVTGRLSQDVTSASNVLAWNDRRIRLI